MLVIPTKREDWAVKKLLLLLSAAAVLLGSGCANETPEQNFRKHLESRSYTVDSIKTESETKNEKKRGKTTVKKNTRIIEAVVTVQGCQLEFERLEAGDTSFYWLDELLEQGEHDWPDYRENLLPSDAVALLDGLRSNPAGLPRDFRTAFEACYSRGAA